MYSSIEIEAEASWIGTEEVGAEVGGSSAHRLPAEDGGPSRPGDHRVVFTPILGGFLPYLHYLTLYSSILPQRTHAPCCGHVVRHQLATHVPQGLRVPARSSFSLLRLASNTPDRDHPRTSPVLVDPPPDLRRGAENQHATPKSRAHHPGWGAGRGQGHPDGAHVGEVSSTVLTQLWRPLARECAEQDTPRSVLMRHRRGIPGGLY